jgi:hypothetical protein
VPAITNCPSCQQPLQIPDEILSCEVCCPACEKIFTATAPSASQLVVPAPRSVSWARHLEPDERTRNAVLGPAVALTVVGALALVLAMFVLAGQIFFAVLYARQGDASHAGDVRLTAFKGKNPDQQLTEIVSGFVGALVGVCWALALIVGAHKMRTFRSYGWAMAATIIAMVPCNLCCIIGMPISIWSLIVLNRPEVMRGFTR